MNQHPLWCLHERKLFGHFNSNKRSEQPASPVLLTRNGPLRTFLFIRQFHEFKKIIVLTYLKFENRLRKFLPQNPLIIRCTWSNYVKVPAILRETSEDTSYLIARLVFSRYTQIWRSICTLEPLRASIRLSSDFTLCKHSSLSFGSRQVCYKLKSLYCYILNNSRLVNGAC